MKGVWVKWIITALGILGIILYAGWEARHLIGGPSLVIETPKDGAVVTEAIISVSGRAEDTTRLSVNGRTIFTDENGYFSSALLLPLGHTIIEVRTENKFGKEKVIYKDVMFISQSPKHLDVSDTTQMGEGATSTDRTVN